MVARRRRRRRCQEIVDRAVQELVSHTLLVSRIQRAAAALGRALAWARSLPPPVLLLLAVRGATSCGFHVYLPPPPPPSLSARGSLAWRSDMICLERAVSAATRAAGRTAPQQHTC
jgi:hypothetical protein